MLDIPKILDNIQDIISAQKDALRDGEIELSASGNKTVYNGHHIRYYEEVLNDLTITTRVPVMKLLMDTLQGLLGGKNGSKIEDAIQEVKQSLGSGGGGDGGGGGSKELRLV